jgi:Fe-S-cluster containining protein
MPTPAPDGAPGSALEFIAVMTPQLRSAVAQHRASLPGPEFAELVSNIRSLFSKFTAKLLEFEPGVRRGVALHQLMDRELKAASHVTVSCAKGCAGCCHYEVEVTRDEAEVLRAVVLGGVPIDRPRLELQAARERKSPEWNRYGSPENRCVFLGEDGGCRIYEHRPSICRKHMVTSPAAACTTAGAPVAPVQILLAEILLSAALSLGTDEGSHGSLARMLRTALRAG